MSSLSGRRVLVGVTGGIAAYKSAELGRLLKKAGHEVRVVMTRGAEAFVTPLTFQALSGEAVRTSLLDPEAEWPPPELIVPEPSVEPPPISETSPAAEADEPAAAEDDTAPPKEQPGPASAV